jgi:hypothetical protein
MAAFLHRLDPTLDLRAGHHVFGAGTFRVGTDIPAGTYRMKHGASSCLWKRLSSFPGTDSDIIEFGAPAGPTVVTIKASDAAFRADRCAVWTSDLSRINSSRTRGIGDGTWIVGTDLQPGVWQAKGDIVCFWERLRGFAGTGLSADEIIQSGQGVDQVVTIKATDKGFSTDHCGTWTRIG